MLDIFYEDKTKGEMTVKINGELDMSSSHDAQEQIEAHVTENIKHVIFDLQNLSSISSAGIRVLISIAKHMKLKKGKISVINLSPPVEKIFKITNFYDLC